MSETFYKRPLPSGLVPFASDESRGVFQQALVDGIMAGYFALAEQFHTQADPAFCGLGRGVCPPECQRIARSSHGHLRWRLLADTGR